MKLPELYHSTSNTILWVGHDYRIIDHNIAYLHFADENGGEEIRRMWSVGSSVIECATPTLQAFFKHLYDRALNGAEVEHRYYCHSPDNFRQFVMRLMPMPGHGSTVLAEHALLVEVPHITIIDLAWEAVKEGYQDAEGTVTQCCSCRKVRHVFQRNRWDLVRSLINNRRISVSHGICPVCAMKQYPGLGLGSCERI